MQIQEKWRALGHDHVVWQLVRYWASLGGKQNVQREWLSRLTESREFSTPAGGFRIDSQCVQLFFEYLELREAVFIEQFNLLRTETAALSYCRRRKLTVGKTTTKSKDHHQSSKALVATVSGLAARVCRNLKIKLDSNPQQRCVWCSSNGLHVSARNLDGAAPSVVNPVVVWEIKEYWGKTSGGSKMSDAVYECQLVGREIRDFEAKTQVQIRHTVFVDGREQWQVRQSDLKRFIDLAHQGLIDRLFVGKAVETEWELYLRAALSRSGSDDS